MNPQCPKCGARMIGPTFHRSWTECHHDAIKGSYGQHLHYRCVCGYDTTRPTRDAKQSQEAP